MKALSSLVVVIAVAGCAHLERPIAGEGITNPVHAANVGKIVFSTQKIARDSPDAATFATTFKDTDRIHARFYLSSPVANHHADEALAKSLEVSVKVDGVPSDAWSYSDELDDNTRTMSTLQILLNPSEEAEGGARDITLEAETRWARFLTQLPPGKHTLRFELYTETGSFRSETPAAVGELTLMRTAAQAKSGFTFAKLKAGMVNAKLESAALDALQKYAQQSGWPEKIERVKIQSETWELIRDPVSGAVTGRELSVFALIRKGAGCQYRPFTVAQASDRGRFAPNFEYDGMGSLEDIDCDE